MKKQFLSVLCLTLAVSSTTLAYDSDTHFYSTALMLIFSGIKPPVAYKIAAAAQQIDESAITTPMFGERQRRLFHFPQELTDTQIPLPTGPELADYLQKIDGADKSGQIQKTIDVGIRDVVHGQEFHALAGVIRDNPFAYNLAFYATQRKSIWMLGAAIHVLHDSFGHRNYSAAFGHANAGHDPDRPYLHWENYKKMVLATTEMMSMVRTLLPENAIDRNFVLPGTNKKAIDATADEIHKAFVENPDIQLGIARNILRSTEYTHYVISGVLYGMKKMGAIVSDDAISQILTNTDLFTKGKDSYEILSGLIEGYVRMPEAERMKTFDINVIRKDITGSIGLGRSIDQILDSRTQVLGPDRDKAIQEISMEIAENILLTQVPKELTNERSFLVEKENIFRKYEMQLRLDGVKSLVAKFTGKNIIFAATKPETVIQELIDNDDDLKSVSDTLKNTEIVTLTKSEKLKWSLQMFRYYVVDLVLGMRLKNGWGKGWTNVLNWVTATPLAHVKTDPRVITLLEEKEFQAAVQSGLLQKILTPTQADKMIQNHENLQKMLQVKAAQLIEAKRKNQPEPVGVKILMCSQVMSK